MPNFVGYSLPIIKTKKAWIKHGFDSVTEFALEKSSENELDSDVELLNLLVPEANYHVVDNPTVEKTLEEGSSKAEKKVKRKRKEKDKRKKRSIRKEYKK